MMTTDWWDIAPLGWENILVCLVCGTLVGLERQLRGKPVGIRTSSLIILGTYWANRALGEFDPETNPAAQLRQLWFGAGVHFCLGAPLAMAQINLVLGAVLAARNLRIVERQASRGVLIPSYRRLVLRGSS